jgi:hypothetical protein
MLAEEDRVTGDTAATLTPDARHQIYRRSRFRQQ